MLYAGGGRPLKCEFFFKTSEMKPHGKSAERTCIPEFGYCAPSDQKNRFCDLAPAGVTVWPKSADSKIVFFIFWLPEAKFHRTNFHQMTAPPMRKDP